MRTAEIKRKTKETDISLKLTLEGGERRIDTGIGFFDHMLNSFAVHSGFGLTLTCKGDLEVDGHHSVEDCGIALGQALAQCVGDKAGIARFGQAFVPMDEALGFCALDISGRPYLVFDAPMPQPMCGQYDTCLTVEFMRALAVHAGLKKLDLSAGNTRTGSIRVCVTVNELVGNVSSAESRRSR